MNSKLKWLIPFLTLSILVTIIAPNLVSSTHLNASAVEAEGDIEYYRMGSSYMEIQPYSGTKNNPKKTYGVPISLTSNERTYVGQGRAESLSAYADKYSWGNHAMILGPVQNIPTHTPDGFEITGIEWIKPLNDGIAPNSYETIRNYHEQYIANGYKNTPQEVNFTDKPAMLMQSEASGALPVSWDSERSMKDPLAFSSQNFGVDYTYDENTRNLQIKYLNVDARPPKETIDNMDRLYWNMQTEVSKTLYHDALEIRAHYYYGHNIVIEKNASPEYLRSLVNDCDLQPRTVNGIKEIYCAVGKTPSEEVNQYSNPARNDFSFVLEENFSNLTKTQIEYYRQMPGGTARTSKFNYNSWYDHWTSSYIVPSGSSKTKEQNFADMFNGVFELDQAFYRLYAPTLIKFKVEIPPTNFKLPYTPYKSVQPNDAKYNASKGTLDVRTVGVLDQHKKPEEKLKAQVKIQIKNLSHPNKGFNEYNGMFPYKDLEFDKPNVWVELPTHLPVEITPGLMVPTGGPGLTQFPVELIAEEQELHIRMEINPEDDPTEPVREDNVWEKKVKIPANTVDLIAKMLENESTRPTTDWSKVATDIRFQTEALNTKEDPNFLDKYPTSPVTLEYTVTGGGYNETKKLNYTHVLSQKLFSNRYQLLLPNNLDIPGYNVKLKLTINPNKNLPPHEVTFDNNTLEKTIFIPTIPKPEKPITPDIPPPDLILPWYNLERLQCYLPHNPKTGQKAQILYDIGTYEHKHDPTWLPAPNDVMPDLSTLQALNWGRNIGWETNELEFGCIEEDSDAVKKRDEYYKNKQEATAFTWWDTEDFQKSQGSTQTEKKSPEGRRKYVG